MDPSKLAATAKWLNEDSSTTLCANTTIIPQVDSLELNGDLSLQLSSQHNSVDKGNHKSDTNSHLLIVDLDSLKDGTHEAYLETTHLHGFSSIHTAGFRGGAGGGAGGGGGGGAGGRRGAGGRGGRGGGGPM